MPKSFAADLKELSWRPSTSVATSFENPKTFPLRPNDSGLLAPNSAIDVKKSIDSEA